MLHRSLFVTVLLLCVGLTTSVTTAQPPTIITVTASEWHANLYEDTIIPLFEAEHPNIQVEFVYWDNMFFGSPIYQSEDEESTFYDDLRAYAESADVLYMYDSNLSPYAVHTGFFLDLTPLIAVDENINETDFYPAAWHAFQWDGGMWALPYSMEVQVLVYDRGAFDLAGIVYPDQSWRLEDYIRVVEELHTYNENGEVELSALNPLNPVLILYNDVGSLFDTTTFPTQPDFSNPEFQRQLEIYTNYYESYEFAQLRGYSFDEVPMSISYPYQLNNNNFGFGEDKDWAVSLLPGNIAGSRAQGFAISSGTAFPQEAYEFVSFMTENIDIFTYGANGRPARHYLTLDDLDDENTFIPLPEFDPEIQAVLDEAYQVAISGRDMWFSEVFYLARSDDEDDLPIDQMLEEQRLEIIALLEEAQTYQSEQLTVAAPTLPPDLIDGEIALNFGMNMQRGGNVRQELWDSAIEDFIAQHPTVGNIDLEYQMYGPDGKDEDIDCWYDSYGGNLSSLNEPPDDLLALNPLMTADPDFDPNAFLSGILQTVEISDLYYAYPLTVQPVTMWINEDKFRDLGLPIPQTGWTTNEFVNALVVLGENREDMSEPVLRSNLFSAMWFNMLVTSFGGQLVDESTVPSTYMFSDPATLAAIEQLAGYIDDGLIQYDGLFSNNSVFFGGLPEDDLILIDTLGDVNFTLVNQDFQNGDYPLQVVTYPDGIFMPVAYSTGAAYIANDTVHVQACYDWISQLAQQPELFIGMPSRPALFTDPDLIAQQGDNLTALYETLTSYFTAPNAFIFPNTFSITSDTSNGAWLETDFFYWALDNSILNGADLESEMIQAEENITLYRECVAGIEELSPQEISDMWERSQEEGIAHQRQYTDCAITLVPEMRERYSFYYRDSD